MTYLDDEANNAYKALIKKCTKEKRQPTKEEMDEIVRHVHASHGRMGATELRKRYGKNAHSQIGKMGAMKRWELYRKRKPQGELDRRKKA